MQESWPLTRALEASNQTTGVPVLMDLYQRPKDTPETVSLAELWQQLGIELREGTVVFRDDTPLATVRVAITRSVYKNSAN